MSLICRESVSTCGEIASCCLTIGHQGKHQLVWTGDPQMLARKIAARYKDGLVEIRRRLVETADDIQADIDSLTENP